MGWQDLHLSGAEWRRNKVSEVEPSDECLSGQTRRFLAHAKMATTLAVIGVRPPALESLRSEWLDDSLLNEPENSKDPIDARGTHMGWVLRTFPEPDIPFQTPGPR